MIAGRAVATWFETRPFRALLTMRSKAKSGFGVGPHPEEAAKPPSRRMWAGTAVAMGGAEP
jgi:hypothetical protein